MIVAVRPDLPLLWDRGRPTHALKKHEIFATILVQTMRNGPNILITGTPGTGKSSLAETLQHNFDGLKHLNISELIKERKLGDHYNQEWDTWEFDDDKVILTQKRN